MAYTQEWTPKSVDITRASSIKVTTWDGRSVPDLTYFISGNAIVLTVPYPNKYKITVKVGSTTETARIYVPEAANSSLEVRLHRYIDEVLEDYVPGAGSPANIKPDPDPNYEGYFIFSPPEETA